MTLTTEDTEVVERVERVEFVETAVLRGTRVLLTRLDKMGMPIGDPEELLGTHVHLEIGDPGEEVDLLWEEEYGGVHGTGRGLPAIRALVIVLGWDLEKARAALQTEMNKRLAKVRAAERVHRSMVKRYSSSVLDAVPREVLDAVLKAEGWEWVPTMSVGAGAGAAARVHIRYAELPEEALADRVILRCSSDEYVAVVGGVVWHPHDPSRNGTRTVYGYYAQAQVRELFAT